MSREKLVDVVVLTVIVALSLGVAYVTFGILDSSTEGTAAGYKVGGAIAGFLVTVSILGGLYKQQRRSSDEVEGLRRQNEELKQKVLRSVPANLDSEVEIAERERIVLARPKSWEAKGGILFSLQERATATSGSLPTLFTLQHVPIPESKRARKRDNWEERQDEFYLDQRTRWRELADAGLVASPSHEYIHLGAGDNPIKCLKTIVTVYVQVSSDKNPFTGETMPVILQISKEDYETLTKRQEAGEPVSVQGPPTDSTNPVVSTPPEATDQVSVARSATEAGEPVSVQGPPTDSTNPVVSSPPEATDQVSVARSATKAGEPVSEEGPPTDSTNPGVSSPPEVTDRSSVARSATNGAAAADGAEAASAGPTQEEPEVKLVLGQQLIVACYHPVLQKVFAFTFTDDLETFPETSAEIDKVLHSARFLV